MLLGMGFEEKRVRCAAVRANNDMEKAFEIIDTISEKEVQKFTAQCSTNLNRKKPRYIPLELQRLFTELQCVDQSSVSTEGTIRLNFSEKIIKCFPHWLLVRSYIQRISVAKCRGKSTA